MLWMFVECLPSAGVKIGVIMDLETEFVLWIWKDKAVRDSESEI